MKPNVGFSGGCNQGAELARGELLYFVNNDILFQDGCLEELARVVLLDPKSGIVGSRLLYEDETVQHAGIVFDCFTHNPKHRGVGHPSDDPFLNIPLRMQAVTAASMMIRRDLFMALGGFDEAYRNGFEDVELCLKVQGAGYDVIYNPRSVLYHYESKSKGRFRSNDKNIALFRQRWRGRYDIDEMKLLSRKDLFLLCFTEDLARMRRRRQLFSLVNYLDARHPDVLNNVPLYLLEKLKDRRFQKSCTFLFDELMRRGAPDQADILYRYFRQRYPHRIKYLRRMQALKKGTPSRP